jgi:hypothetical protein
MKCKSGKSFLYSQIAHLPLRFLLHLLLKPNLLLLMVLFLPFATVRRKPIHSVFNKSFTIFDVRVLKNTYSTFSERQVPHPGNGDRSEAVHPTIKASYIATANFFQCHHGNYQGLVNLFQS